MGGYSSKSEETPLECILKILKFLKIGGLKGKNINFSVRVPSFYVIWGMEERKKKKKPWKWVSKLQSVQFSSVTQSCPTLCNPMNRSTPGLPVHNQLPEFTQTHAHRVRDDIQPSHPMSAPSPPAPSPSQHQGLFQ